MGAYGAGKGSITLYTTAEKVAYVAARADRLRWSNSQALDAVLDHWLASGAPPLSLVGDLDPPAVPPELLNDFARELKEAREIMDLAKSGLNPSAIPVPGKPSAGGKRPRPARPD